MSHCDQCPVYDSFDLHTRHSSSMHFTIKSMLIVDYISKYCKPLLNIVWYQLNK